MTTRTLPFSEDAEKGVLCSIVLNPFEVMAIADQQLTADSFYVPAHAAIYSALRSIIGKKRPVDFPTLKNELAEQLNDVGGVQYLNEIWSFIPTGANARYYVNTVREKSIVRKAILSLGEVIEHCYDPSLEFETIRDEIEAAITGIALSTGDEEKPFTELLMEWIEDLENRHQKIEKNGVKFGIPCLDNEIGSIQPGEVCLIAAKTSHGKTALAMNAVDYSTFDKGLATRIFSAEMSTVQLLDRLAARRARVSMRSFRHGLFSQIELSNLSAYTSRFCNAPIFINQQRPITASAICSTLRRDKVKNKISYAVVDYIQLITGESRRSGNREQEVAQVSTAIKSIALELDIPVIVISQLNKNGEVRESDRLIHDADVGIIIWSEDGEDRKNMVLRIDKMRSGPTDLQFPIRFIGEYQIFEEGKEVPQPQPEKPKRRRQRDYE